MLKRDNLIDCLSSSRKPSFLRKMLIIILISCILSTGLYFLYIKTPIKEVVSNKTIYINSSNTTKNTSNISVNLSEVELCLRSKNKDLCLKELNNSSALLLISNTSIRDTSIYEKAIKEMNISLCEWIENKSLRKKCDEKINPPCSNSTNAALCLALYYNNYSYCLDKYCKLDFAIKTNNSQPCYNISSVPYKYACLSIISGKDFCYNLSIFEKDFCYQIYAQRTKQFDFCKYISNNPYKYECFLNASIELKDPKQCSYVDLLNKWKCYSRYSFMTGDITGCDMINSFAEGSKDKCYFDYGFKFADFNACKKIVRDYYREACYADIVLLKRENLTIEMCNNIDEENPWKEKCMEYAKENQ